jgi:hypothetical protein
MGVFANDWASEVDASVESAEAPIVQTRRDLLRGDAGRKKLAALHDAVLPVRDRPDDPIGRSSERL